MIEKVGDFFFVLILIAFFSFAVYLIFVVKNTRQRIGAICVACGFALFLVNHFYTSENWISFVGMGIVALGMLLNRKTGFQL
jgi:hypothetical protein